MSYPGCFSYHFTHFEELSDLEKNCIDVVYKAISYDKLHSISLSPRVEKELDPQVLKWLKRKFSPIASPSTSGSNHITMVSPLDFKQTLDTSVMNQEKVRQDILKMFDTVDEWNFDVFTLNDLCQGNTLFITSYTLFLKYDFLNKFKIPEETLVAFLKEVQTRYRDNPYHNSMHAADVVQIMHYLIHKGGLKSLLSNEDTIAAIISALVHDLDHPGLNNAFQINTRSYLATLYNDRSVLENHHCAQAFELLRSPQFNFLINMPQEQRKMVRGYIVDMILATDMGEHSRICGQFKARVESEQEFSSKEDIRLILQMAIKFADVSNPTRPNELAIAWARRIEQEFYQQGDKERELSLSMSPFMDRGDSSLPKLQISFITKVVTPMLEQFCKVFPDMNFVFKHLEENKRYWETLEAN